MPRHMSRVATAICVVAIALAPSVAHGQQPKRSAAPPPPLTGNIIRDIGNLKDNATGATSQSQSPLQDLLKIVTDTDEAIRLSTAIPSVQDAVGGSCWKSFSGISLVVKEHPDLLTGKVAADLEALRLIHISLNQVCANANCKAMWDDLQNVAGALNPTVIPISLTGICAKVPTIATSAAPTAPPVVVPATPAVPTAPQQ